MIDSAASTAATQSAWVAAALAGLFSSIITLTANHLLQERRERRAWRRDRQKWLLDQRLRHYIEILEYVTSLRRVLRQGGIKSREGAKEVFAESRDLNLRIRLMSSGDVREKWKPLRSIIEDWQWGKLKAPEKAREDLWRLSDGLLDQLRRELTELDRPM
jgi:hypothetical protein